MTNCFEAIKDFSAFLQILQHVFLHVLTLFQFVGPGQALTASEGQLLCKDLCKDKRPG